MENLVINLKEIFLHRKMNEMIQHFTSAKKR